MPGAKDTEQDKSLSSSPSASSPAGGSRAASGTGYSSGSSGSRSSSGPSKSSPAGGAQAASGYGDGSRSNTTSSTGFGDSAHSRERERDTSLSGRSASTGFGGAGGDAPSREMGKLATANDRLDAVGNSWLTNPFTSAVMWAADRLGGSAAQQRTPTGFAPLSGGLFRSAQDSSMSALDAWRSATTPPSVSARQGETSSMAALNDWRSGPMVAPQVSQRQAEASSMATYERAKDAWFDKVLGQIIGEESAGNPKAKNPLSSATGLAQFTSGTWLGMIDKYRPDLVTGRSRQELLDLRFDPTISMEMATQFTKDNIARLEAAGLPVTAANVYAMHFLGEGGGPAALKADPSTPAVDVLGAAAVKANPGIMSGKTIGQVLGAVSKKMSGVPDTVSDMLAGERFSNETAAIPSPRASFVDRYLSPNNREIDRSLGPAMVPAADASRAAIPEAMREKGMMTAAAERQMRSPRSMEGPGGIFLDAPPPQQDERIAADRAREVAAAPAPAAAPPAAPGAAAPAVEAEKAKRTGGLGGAIVAGGIDLLVGGVPGVGLVNTLAGLFTEGGSLGERVVDDFLSGDSQSVSDTASFKSGDSAVDRGAVRKPKDEQESEGESQSKTAAKAFEERYLLNLWRPDLPTPRQKWPGLLG